MNHAPPRKTKLYRKKMWAIAHPGGGVDLCATKRSADWRASLIFPPYSSDRVFRVLITELPKAAGRGRKS